MLIWKCRLCGAAIVDATFWVCPCGETAFDKESGVLQGAGWVLQVQDRVLEGLSTEHPRGLVPVHAEAVFSHVSVSPEVVRSFLRLEAQALLSHVVLHIPVQAPLYFADLQTATITPDLFEVFLRRYTGRLKSKRKQG